MHIGVPKEVKTYEYRVGLTPGSVRELVGLGHVVSVESQAGEGIGCTDADYLAAGAHVVPTAADVFASADMIVKVKEPTPQECRLLRAEQILFTYLHLAPVPELAQQLVDSGVAAMAYETVTDVYGGLPLLAPMSEVAGRMAAQVGARCLEKEWGGSGILLGGAAGVRPAKVVVLGGGVAGSNAARIALGMGAYVTVVDKNTRRLNELDWLFQSQLQTAFSTREILEECVRDADVVIGTVLVPGAAAPKLVTRQMLKQMRPGSVIVDVAIDQGGCCETSRPTTHADPTYIEEGVVHYCVTNMPGAVARTSTFALNNATLPFIKTIATKGLHQALTDDAHLRNGLNVYNGAITHPTVAQDLGMKYVAPEVARDLFL